MQRFLGGLVAAVVVSLCSLAPAPAQPCGGYTYYRPQVYYPPVHYQTQVIKEYVPVKEYVRELVPVPVAVPFQAIIPVSGAIYTGPVGYQAVAPGTAYPPQVQAAAPAAQAAVAAPAAPAPVATAESACDAKLKELEARFEQRLRQLSQQVAPAGDELPPAPPTAAATSLNTRVKQIFTDYGCASCHKGAKAKGGITLFDAAGNLNPRLDRSKVHKAVDEGRMPPDAQKDPGQALSDEEVLVIEEWAGRAATTTATK